MKKGDTVSQGRSEVEVLSEQKFAVAMRSKHGDARASRWIIRVELHLCKCRPNSAVTQSPLSSSPLWPWHITYEVFGLSFTRQFYTGPKGYAGDLSRVFLRTYCYTAGVNDLGSQASWRSASKVGSINPIWSINYVMTRCSWAPTILDYRSTRLKIVLVIDWATIEPLGSKSQRRQKAGRRNLPRTKAWKSNSW
jgi:hypothetical protein